MVVGCAGWDRIAHGQVIAIGLDGQITVPEEAGADTREAVATDGLRVDA